jgi:hypothetical protein
MDSNINLIILNVSNYAIWEPNMETLLNSKGMWKYMKSMILDPINDQTNFIVDGKKDKVVGVITTYISQEIHFHINGIDYPHQVWNKLMLSNRFNEILIMQLEKELISLDPYYIDKIYDYLACVKEIQLKLGQCGNNY